MVKDKEEAPYGYIYKITNTINVKVYIGKTGKTIEERWSKHLENAEELKRAREANPHKNIAGTHLNNAINKYGSNAFIVNQEDVAYSREELNEKERHWVKEYDSMNPDKGYNMTEGGEGGRQSPEVIKRMTEINQKIARNLETLENMSKAISEKWQDQNYQKNVSKGVTDKWQQAKFRERQLRAKTEGKREIPDKMKFLKEIKELKKKDLTDKYDMDGKSISDRIKEMLGHHGVNNFSQAKKYLEDKNLKDVLNDINKWQKDHHQKTEIKKEISNKREFLKDIQNMQGKEIAQKYDMNRSTINKRIQEMLGEHGVHNYTDAKKYLEDKNLNKVLKDIDERLSKQAERYQGTTEITDKKQFIQDIQTMQKNEINYKYGMDAKTINQKMRDMFGPDGPKNYTELKKYLQDKNVHDVLKEIEEKTKENEGKKEAKTDETKDKGESKSQDNLKEKTDKDPKSEEKEDLKEQSKEENEEKNSDINKENSESNQNPENSDENLREKEEKSAEIEENIESENKEMLDKDMSKKEEENNISDSEKNMSNDSSISEKEAEYGKSVENMEDLNMVVKNYAGIDKNSSEREQDIKGLDENQDSKNLGQLRYIDIDIEDIESIETVEDIKAAEEKDYTGVDEGDKKEVPDYAFIDNFLDNTKEIVENKSDKGTERGKEYSHT